MGKRKIIKVLLTTTLVGALLVGCGSVDEKSKNNNSVASSNSVNEEIGRKYAEQYLKDNFNENMNMILQDEDIVADIFDGKEFKTSDFNYAKPYIVYRFEESQEEIYYFPVYSVSDNKIYFVIAVLGTENGYTMNLPMVDADLNQIDYLNNDCVVYYYDNILTFETENKKMEINSNDYIQYNVDSDAYENFINAGFDEKRNIIKTFEENNLRKKHKKVDNVNM